MSPSITFAKWLIYSWVSWAIWNYAGSTLFRSMIGPLNPCHSPYQSDLNLNQLHLCHLRFPILQVIYFVFILNSPCLVTFYFILFVFVTKSGFIHCHPIQKRNSKDEIWIYFFEKTNFLFGISLSSTAFLSNTSYLNVRPGAHDDNGTGERSHVICW